jgi:hypothetical protein
MMLVTVDKSALNAEQRGYPYRPNLAELIESVGSANPLLSFVCDEHCLTRDWDREKKLPDGGTGGYEHFVYRVKVYQDGEELGAVRTDTRYRRSIGSESVYGVESFRIRKERGNMNLTQSKDLKVILRTAKKAFVARANDELYNHIYHQVRNGLESFTGSLRNAVRYSIDPGQESMSYAEAAYQAHLEGKTTVELPVKLKSVSNYEEYLRRCSEYQCASYLMRSFTDKLGYAVKVLDDAQIVTINLESDGVTKYKSFDELPSEIANKFAMFKVIKEQEPYEHIGVALGEKFYYVVK